LSSERPRRVERTGFAVRHAHPRRSGPHLWPFAPQVDGAHVFADRPPAVVDEAHQHTRLARTGVGAYDNRFVAERARRTVDEEHVEAVQQHRQAERRHQLALDRVVARPDGDAGVAPIDLERRGAGARQHEPAVRPLEHRSGLAVLRPQPSPVRRIDLVVPESSESHWNTTGGPDVYRIALNPDAVASGPTRAVTGRAHRQLRG
jgi:hypothetical protein